MIKRAEPPERSVYSAARLEAISNAVEAWWQTLPLPRNPKVKEMIGVSWQGVGRYRAGEYGPGPDVMCRFWQKTKDPVFLLTKQERASWISRKREIPLKDFPHAEDFKPEPLPEPASQPCLDATDPSKAAAVVENLLISLLTVTRSIELILPANLELPDSARRKAIDLVRKIAKLFRITEKDYPTFAELEKDPVAQKRLERLLGGLGLKEE